MSEAPAPDVIVCGLGNVGSRTSALLRRLGLSVVVLTERARADRLRRAEHDGVRVVTGDARDRELLGSLGLARARTLVVATDSDMVNIETALDARDLRGDLRLVLRVFDPHLAQSLEATLGTARALGASTVAAPALAWSALGQDVLGVFEVDGVEWVVARFTLDESSELCGLDAAAARERFGLALIGRESAGPLEPGEALVGVAERERFAMLRGLRLQAAHQQRRNRSVLRAAAQIWRSAPVSLRRALALLLSLTLLSVVVFQVGLGLSTIDALYYVVTTVTTTGYGDITPKDGGTAMKLYACSLMLSGSLTMAILFSLFTDFVVGERVRAVLGQPSERMHDHVIVVGMGRVGFRTLTQLRQIGALALAIELDPNNAFSGSLRREGLAVFGDGRVPDTLRAAGVERARAVVAATGDDAANLATVLLARRLAPGLRTVTRLFDDELAAKAERGKLTQVALSSSRVAAPAFAASALLSGVVCAFTDEQGLVALCAEDQALEGVERVELPAAGGGSALVLAVRRVPFVGEPHAAT